MNARSVLFLVAFFVNPFPRSVAGGSFSKYFERRNDISRLIYNVPGGEVSSVLRCGDLCARSSSCKAFCYSQSTALCHLSQPYDPIVQQYNGSDFECYNPNCGGNRYGPSRCSLPCGQCEGNAQCDPVTGHCPRCQPGWYLPLCQQECEAGFHGKDCNSTCGNCQFNTTCNHVFGECPQGCTGDYSGRLCVQDAATGGPETSTIAGAIGGVLVVVLVVAGGIAIIIIIIRRHRRRQGKSADSADGEPCEMSSSGEALDSNPYENIGCHNIATTAYAHDADENPNAPETYASLRSCVDENTYTTLKAAVAERAASGSE